MSPGLDAMPKNAPAKNRRFFLIPASEYSLGAPDKAPRFAFVINPEKHKEIPPIS